LLSGFISGMSWRRQWISNAAPFFSSISNS
jgi:hypothetical protein